jgi:toxin ParE1/3/4
MRVVLADSAVADLIAIGRYIGTENPGRAATFVEELEQRCIELGFMPRRFPLLPHRRNKKIRRRVYGNYLIFYRIAKDQVEVLRVLHGAQDYEALLFDEI